MLGSPIQPALCWLLQVVGAATTALVRHIGEGCWEDGVLLSQLWNLQASLLGSRMEAAQSQAAMSEREVQRLRHQIRR